MFLDVHSVNRSDYRKGNFDPHCTHVLKVNQDNGSQLFVGTKCDLTLFGAYILDLISVRSVYIYTIEEYE